MTGLLETAGAYALVIVATVEAIRTRVPSLDGWRVLVVAAGVAIALCALFIPSATAEAVLQAGRLAALSWLIAVGGNAWVAKIAAKGKQTTVVDSDTWREAPTVKDRPTVPPTKEA